MSQQAINSLGLYRGGNPETIKKLLAIQDKGVVKELMDHFKATDLDDLAFHLSFGF